MSSTKRNVSVMNNNNSNIKVQTATVPNKIMFISSPKSSKQVSSFVQDKVCKSSRQLCSTGWPGSCLCCTWSCVRLRYCWNWAWVFSSLELCSGVEDSGSPRVLYGLTKELFLLYTVPLSAFKVSSCPSLVWNVYGWGSKFRASLPDDLVFLSKTLSPRTTGLKVAFLCLSA